MLPNAVPPHPSRTGLVKQILYSVLYDWILTSRPMPQQIWCLHPPDLPISVTFTGVCCALPDWGFESSFIVFNLIRQTQWRHLQWPWCLSLGAPLTWWSTYCRVSEPESLNYLFSSFLFSFLGGQRLTQRQPAVSGAQKETILIDTFKYGFKYIKHIKFSIIDI